MQKIVQSGHPSLDGSAIPTDDLEVAAPPTPTLSNDKPGKSNKNFFKKIPKNAETANILVTSHRGLLECHAYTPILDSTADGREC